VGVYVWVRSAFAFAKKKKYFVVKFAKGGVPEERVGILRLFFAEIFSRFKHGKPRNMKENSNSRNIGKIKLDFIYYKAKRLGLAPECLCLASECFLRGVRLRLL
jgi:hypothetical protein